MYIGDECLSGSLDIGEVRGQSPRVALRKLLVQGWQKYSRHHRDDRERYKDFGQSESSA
jgi:hypothetical protein